MLGTVLNEGRYIRDAVKNRSKLPSNYWRAHLAMYAFRKDEMSELPKALQSNFCPLFWVTNFLLLVSPLWVPVYIFFGLLDKAFDKIEELVLLPAGAYIKKRKEENVKIRGEVYKEEMKKKYTYDPKFPNLMDLICGRESIESVLETMRAWGQIQKDKPIDWGDDKFLDNIHDHEARYFATFRAYHGKSWKDEYTRLKEVNAIREKEREERHKKLREAEKERKANRDRQFAKLFSYAKPVCKFVALAIGIPIACVVSYHLYFFLGFCWYWIARFLHFVFVLHIYDVLIIVVACAITIAALFATQVCRKHIWSPVGKGFGWTWKKLILPPLKIIAAPFVWLGGILSGTLEFVFNFIRMFFSENCPHIEWEKEEEETKESSK